MTKTFTPAGRRWVYHVLLAAFPVACFYVLQLVPAAPPWLALAMALLNVNDEEPTNGT